MDSNHDKVIQSHFSRGPRRGGPVSGATLDELRQNLGEVVAMLLEDGDPHLEAEFVGTQSIVV